MTPFHLRNSFANARGFCVALAATAFFSWAPLHAQSTLCPSGGQPNSGTRGDGDDIQCRVGNLLAKQQTLINTLQTKLSTCDTSKTGNHCDLLQDHLTRIQAGQSRAMHANGRLKGSDFSDLNAIRKTKCMGKSTDCASGNTGMGGATITGGETDPGVGTDLADQLDDLGHGVDKLNEIMSTPSAPMPLSSVSVKSPGFVDLYDFTTDPQYPHFLHLIQNPKADIVATFTAYIAAGVAEGARTIVEDACNQVVVALGEGGNVRAGCLPFSITAVVLDKIAELLEFTDNDTAAWDAHGAYERAENLNENLSKVDDDVSAVQGSVGDTTTLINNLQDKVNALQSNVTALQIQVANLGNTLGEKLFVTSRKQQQILQFLLEPDGGRSMPSTLLTCTGDGNNGTTACPPVTISCSQKTGQCSYSGNGKP